MLPSCPEDCGERLRLRDLPVMLQAHAEQLRHELGGPIQLMTFDPGKGPRWILGPSTCNRSITIPSYTPTHTLDRKREILITDAPTAEGMVLAISSVASLGRLRDGVHPIVPARTLEQALERVQIEVGESWPSFSLKGIDWAALCDRHVSQVRAAKDPIPVFQGWLAHLGDAHTRLRPTAPQGTLPYRVWLQQDAAILLDVPPNTPAWRAGARPGWRLLGVDPRACWTRTAAPAYARPLIAGMRLVTGPVGTERSFQARSPAGSLARWTEPFPETPWGEALEARLLPSGSGLLKIRRWLPEPEFEESLDSALESLRGAKGLIVDLRGNGGGHVWTAHRFRARFLHTSTHLGSLRYRIPGGPLAEAEPLRQEPAPRSQRWDGPVRFLTDALTHSASEDALLGLQGLPWVEVLGEPSGGGSRRERVLPLLPGWDLLVSTALTYDRQWRCVEAAGIPVDRLHRPPSHHKAGEDTLLQIADRRW
ncbi:MAG: hypothetical protein JXX28_18280 [Deltaproteobacteria bacterium]|nr:hypothetical protein [Deltaproteobacteria bacterium]